MSKKKKKRNDKMIAALACVGALLVVLLIVIGLLTGLRFVDKKAPNFTAETILYVYPSMTKAQVAEKLYPVCKHKESLDRELANIGTIKPGRYVIKESYSSAYVARSLVFGWQTPCRLVINGPIKTREELAVKVSSQLLVDSASFCAALSDAALLSKYSLTPQTAFYAILPDTYEVYWTAESSRIINTLHSYTVKYWTEERLAKASALGLNANEVYILASIVALETNRESEYPKVASVYLNRLRLGMPLQACPTICYIYGYKIKRVLREYLKNPSAYNTYKYKGLPPGPICIPPKACIEAVLNAPKTDYLYFSASPKMDGTNRFTSSYKQHVAWGAEYKAALDSKK